MLLFHKYPGKLISRKEILWIEWLQSAMSDCNAITWTNRTSLKRFKSLKLAKYIEIEKTHQYGIIMC